MTSLIRHTAILLTAVLCLAACSTESLDDPGSGSGSTSGSSEVRTEFFITMGDVALSGGTAGRATPADGSYDPGSGYENYIDIDGGDFRVLFFSNDNDGSKSKYITALNVANIAPVTAGGSSKTYRVYGTVPGELLADNSFRVLILANWGSYPTLEAGATTIDQLRAMQEALFSFGQNKTEIGPESLIPLFGIRRFNNVVFDASDYADLGTIHLLRAYAKVDVSIDSERWSIISVRIANSRTAGYKAPANVYDESDYVKGSHFSDYTNEPNVPDCPSASLAFTRIAADSSAYRIYIPEARNIAYASGTPFSESNRARIGIRFRDRNTGYESFLGEQFIDFKYYQAPEGHDELKGKHFNVMRNNWYRYTIEKGDEIADLKVYLDIQPYAAVNLDPGFGLKRDPVDGYIILKEITQRDGSSLPTLLYDDRYGNYYDFQKYRLISNYSEKGVVRLDQDEKEALGLSGDIWLVKCANHHTDDVGQKTDLGSLFYDGSSGIYYDFRGEPLNLRYVNTSPRADVNDTEMEIVDIDRDFQFNNFVLSRGDNSVESSFYDFAHGNYKGAFNPELSIPCDEDLGTIEDRPDHDKLSNFYRARTYRLTGGWIEIVPYWLVESPRVCRLYYNIYTDRYYDLDGYCLQDNVGAGCKYPDFEFNVSAGDPYVILVRDPDTEEPTLTYRRNNGKYYDGASDDANEVPRPSDLLKDPRLQWPPVSQE